ncbi:MAG TPA: DUF4340 domain-containing protein [Polyangiaceae bacterium]|nr:DUF4340 domain-containing protein [Polyangiaceae bacterium]
MLRRGLGLHVGLFVVASLLGLRAWTAEDEPNKKPVAAELWSGRVSDVSRIEFHTEKKTVSLEPKEDEAGRYFIGSVETVAEKPKPAHAAADAGAPAATPPPTPESSEPKRFISLSKGAELAESLATLKASRVLGKIDPERLPDFGFDKTDQGELKVVVAGKEHSLQLGEKTPGGSDRYVRDTATSEAYVISGTIANDLTSADNRLIERDFHDFGDDKVAKVVIKSATGSREVVRHAVEKDFWAHPESPDTKDETVSNWMTKVDRLRVTTYVESLDPAPKPEDQVVTLEYYNDHGRKLGFLDLVRRPAKDAKEKPDYVARSERTRWNATVLKSTAEQIDQDLGSVLAP